MRYRQGTRLSIVSASMALVATALAPETSNAGVLLLQDNYGPTATSCASPACDVIGEKAWFDIDKIQVSVTTSLAQIDVYSNFNTQNFTPYSLLGLNLNVGDLLFKVDGQYKYGIALHDHAGALNGGTGSPNPTAGGAVTAGMLYEITNGNSGVMTAVQALQHTDQFIYRYDDPVWLWNQGSNLESIVAGSVTVSSSPLSGPTPGYYVHETISFTPTQEFLNIYTGQGFELDFASATCANDILDGSVTGTVPEPGTLAMFTLGFAGLSVSRRKKKL